MMQHPFFSRRFDLPFGIRLSAFELLVVAGGAYLLATAERNLIVDLIVLAIAVVFHEVAHGFVAYKFGDPTAKLQGRLTLNPLAHIDPLGTIILPALLLLTHTGILIGWAKPVPVDPGYFRNPLKEMMWVAIAGPLANITIAFLSSFALHTFGNLGLAMPWMQNFLEVMVVTNVVLAVFNLIPIPPLDGSKILLPFLPRDFQYNYLRLERYGILIVLALSYFGILGVLVRIFAIPLIRMML